MQLTLTSHHAKYFAHDLTRRAANGMDCGSLWRPHNLRGVVQAIYSVQGA